MSRILKPSLLFATKQEIDAAKSGCDPELAHKYIEALEEIAEVAFVLSNYDYDFLEEIDWQPLRDALGKVYLQ